MTIDLFPTIARRIGAALPAHALDGLDVWPLIAHRAGAKNPHSSYWFYYEVNQLQAVTTGDGHWKLQLPHTYRTMRGQTPGHDGIPGPYRNVKVERAELYDLVTDIGETTDVSAAYPGIVNQLEGEAEKARKDLGDALTKRTGAGLRQPAHLAQANPGE